MTVRHRPATPPETVRDAAHSAWPHTQTPSSGWRAETGATTKYPNVYIDTSAYKASRYPRELVEYLRGHGQHKVLFGSNHPAWPAAVTISGSASVSVVCAGGAEHKGVNEHQRTNPAHTGPSSGSP